MYVTELTDQTRDMHRAIVSLMEELETVDWYNQRADVCEDAELSAILKHNRDEEKEHAAMKNPLRMSNACPLSSSWREEAVCHSNQILSLRYTCVSKNAWAVHNFHVLSSLAGKNRSAFFQECRDCP